MARETFLGTVLLPYLECEEAKTIWGCLRYEGLNPDIEMTNSNILFLQKERAKMEVCIVEANVIIKDVAASKYRNVPYSETLNNVLQKLKTIRNDWKNRQEKDWDDYVHWQDTHDPGSVSSKQFDAIQNAAVERWYKYQEAILEAEKHIETWSSKIEKNEKFEVSKATHSAQRYTDLVLWANNRIKKIDEILNKFEKELSNED